jgi:hypothetical protein
MYTDKLVAEMTEQGVFTYDQATQFAEQHNLSVRSVISKIKSLGLEYTPKKKAPATKKGETITKSQVVAAIAASLNANADALAGLAKADRRALAELVRVIGDAKND